MRKIEIKQIRHTLCLDAPAIDYSEAPEFTAADYEARIGRLWELAEPMGFTHLVVYGDREHYNNLCYLTGMDPRFEESLLLLERGRTPRLVLGNECMGYSGMLSLPVERVLYQNFSLMGQPNGASRPLREILADSGIGASSWVGLIGWKRYLCDGEGLVNQLDLPSYIVETLCRLTARENLSNATGLLSDCETGLKHRLEAKEAVQFELMGAKASRKVYRCIAGLCPGMSEIEASGLLALDGEPMSIHPNINFGDANASYGLRSPTYAQKLQIGDIAGVGIGYRGTLVHKQGIYAHNADELPEGRRELVEGFVKPYFAAVAAWYEALCIGATGGEVYGAVDKTSGIEALGIGLNPGHLIHMDEWTDSPFRKNDPRKLHSGMAIQCDFTASRKAPFCSVHAEDGLMLADEALREEIQSIAPNCWARIQARRAFMSEALGIRLAPEVLPFSDLCGVCFPYLADPSKVLYQIKKEMAKCEPHKKPTGAG